MKTFMAYASAALMTAFRDAVTAALDSQWKASSFDYLVNNAGFLQMALFEDTTEEHLELLSELAQMFSEKTFRDQVATATDATDIHHLFSTWAPAPR